MKKYVVIVTTLVIVGVSFLISSHGGEEGWMCVNGEWKKDGQAASCFPTTVVCGEHLKEPKFTVTETTTSTCTVHEDCETPFDYLIRSSCPFESRCIDGYCAVICPDGFYPPDHASATSEVDCR